MGLILHFESLFKPCCSRILFIKNGCVKSKDLWFYFAMFTHECFLRSPLYFFKKTFNFNILITSSMPFILCKIRRMFSTQADLIQSFLKNKNWSISNFSNANSFDFKTSDRYLNEFEEASFKTYRFHFNFRK